MADDRRSLSGSLDDLSLPDLLQFLAHGDKSGRLTLSWRDGHGLVILQGGKIVYAASNAAREALGAILLNRGLVTEEALAEALTAQHRQRETRRLGALLLAQGAIRAADLERVLREQTESVLSGLFRWPGGFFRFEPTAPPDLDHGDVSACVDVSAFLLREGLSAEGAVLQAARLFDEAAARPPAIPVASPELEALKRAAAELRSPMVTAELTQRILGYARQVVPRAVLFAARRQSIHGIGQRGLGGREADERVRSLRLSWERPGIVAAAARTRETIRGTLEPVPGNADLVLGLGGELPTEAVALPLLVGDATALVLYGDNAGSGTPIGSTDGLELYLIQAGLAVEREALQEKLRALGQPVETAEPR